jgi:hypothetical protein
MKSLTLGKQWAIFIGAVLLLVLIMWRQDAASDEWYKLRANSQSMYFEEDPNEIADVIIIPAIIATPIFFLVLCYRSVGYYFKKHRKREKE